VLTQSQAGKQQRPGGRSAVVRQKVLDATLQVLAGGGIGSLSVESIAQVSGVHKTTIYRRWGDCGALVKEAVAEQENRIAPVADTGTLRGDLQALAEAYGAYFSDPVSVAIGRLIVAQRDSDHELGRWMDEYWHSRTERYQTILARAVARGEIRDTALTEVVVELLIAPIVTRALLTQLPLESHFLEQLADAAHLFLLARAGGQPQ